MHDPLFGITYLPSKVLFDPAPPEIYRCESLKEPRSRLWVFGKVDRRELIFYYLYGQWETDFGAGPTGGFEPANDEGIIVVLSPTACREIGAGYALSPDPKEREAAFELGITDDVVAALIADLVAREVMAFGGVQEFFNKVKATGIQKSMLAPPVRAQLEVMEKRSSNERSEAALSGLWTKKGANSDCTCGECFSITFSPPDSTFCVESNQIYVSAYHVLADKGKSLSLFFIKPTEVGTGGAALSWDDFDHDKQIAIIDVSKAEQGTIRMKWLGFRSKTDPTKVYPFGDAYTGEYERARTNHRQ